MNQVKQISRDPREHLSEHLVLEAGAEVQRKKGLARMVPNVRPRLLAHTVVLLTGIQSVALSNEQNTFRVGSFLFPPPPPRFLPPSFLPYLSTHVYLLFVVFRKI